MKILNNFERIGLLGVRAVRKAVNPSRPMIRFLINRNEKDLTGVEIGVARGINAKRMLSRLSIKKLYLIDPYLSFKIGNKNYPYSMSDFEFAKRNLRGYKGKISWILKKSKGAIDDIPNNLDFVYIDGNHSYEYVKDDIKSYFPKLKKGGVIGGDDFSTSFPGVPKAVIEFAGKKHLSIHGDEKDWWIIK
jgi:hypothetical protein